ncbi:MAG: LysR substrate-binding domain-containing protein [Thermodesulfobacteriota bacterium]
MELIQLLSFYQIVKTGSFSKASVKVFRSQSAVSHQIKKLERDFNIKLFTRLGKRMVLTEEGKILFDVVSRVFNDLDNLKRIYADMEQGHSGSLVLASTSGIMTYWFSDFVNRFIIKFRSIKFKLIACDIYQMQELILNGEADIGIGPQSHQLISEKINFVFWRSFDRVLLANRSHPLSKKKNITYSDISKYPLILYRTGETRKMIEDAFVKNNLSYEIIMEIDSTEIIKKFVKKGVGVSVVSSSLITNTERRELFVSDVTKLFGQRSYGMYIMKDKYISAAMRQFIKFITPELLDRLRPYKFQIPELH